MQLSKCAMTVCTSTSKRFLLSWSTEQMDLIARQKKQKTTLSQASLHSSSPPHKCILKQWFLGCAHIRPCRSWSLLVCMSHTWYPVPGAQDISCVPHSALQWCLLSIWHISALLSALFMPPGARSRSYHQGKSSTPNPTALDLRLKEQTQIKPSDLLETSLALPGVRIRS